MDIADTMHLPPHHAHARAHVQWRAGTSTPALQEVGPYTFHVRGRFCVLFVAAAHALRAAGRRGHVLCFCAHGRRSLARIGRRALAVHKHARTRTKN